MQRSIPLAFTKRSLGNTGTKAKKYYVLDTFRNSYPVCFLLDSLFPGPDVPYPDAADGENHQDRQDKDAQQDRDDHMGWIGCNVIRLIFAPTLVLE